MYGHLCMQLLHGGIMCLEKGTPFWSSAHMQPLQRCYCQLTGPVQHSGLQRYDIISTIEHGMGEPPDRRKTAFWRKSSFMQAWQMWKLLPPSGRMETEAELEPPKCALLPASSCTC